MNPEILQDRVMAYQPKNKIVKGRDWFDLIWYVTHKARPKLPLLQAALQQVGPWEKEDLSIDMTWLKRALGEKIASIDWEEAKKDVEPLLRGPSKHGLATWSSDYFLSVIEKL